MSDEIYQLRHRASMRGTRSSHTYNKSVGITQASFGQSRSAQKYSNHAPRHAASPRTSGGIASPYYNNDEVLYNDYLSDSDGDELDQKTAVRSITSASSSSHGDSSYGLSNFDSEWVECKESDTGRTIWYNKETLMVSFDNPILSNFNRVRNDSILKESIAREDIEDHLIPKFLLQFQSQQWDFNNDYVAVFRAQCARIDHTAFLPPPNELKFPEFFSNHTIPKKESFVATIRPPIDFDFIAATHWKMSINVNKTTAADIIEKFVAKINSNFTKKNENYVPSEFVLKVVGNEEYILFDAKKLIIDYEAVRRAVRNEDDVTFALVHSPDFHQVIHEAQMEQEYHKKTFSTKYPPAVRHLDFLHYERHGCGDGKSLIELKLELIQKQQQEEQQRAAQQQIAQQNSYNFNPNQNQMQNQMQSQNQNQNHNQNQMQYSYSQSPMNSNTPNGNNNVVTTTTTTFVYHPIGSTTPTVSTVKTTTNAQSMHTMSYSENYAANTVFAAPPSPTPIQESTTAPVAFNNQNTPPPHHQPYHSANFDLSLNGNQTNGHNYNNTRKQPKMKHAKSARNIPSDPNNPTSPKKLPWNPRQKTMPPNSTPLSPTNRNAFSLQPAGGLQQRDIGPLHVNGQSTVIRGKSNNPNNNTITRTIWNQMNESGGGSAPSSPRSHPAPFGQPPSKPLRINAGTESSNLARSMHGQSRSGRDIYSSHHSMPQNIGGPNGVFKPSKSARNIHKDSASSLEEYNIASPSTPGGSAAPSPHRMSITDHRRAHQRANSMSGSIKLGTHNVSGAQDKSVSPYGSEPSLRDSTWLRNQMKNLNASGDHNTILLEDHHQQYRFRISGLSNVTKLPRYVDMQDRIKRVIVTHELWMGPLSYNECVYSTPNIARVSDNMKFADWFTAKKLKYSDLPREATISCTIYGLSQHEKNKNEVVSTPLGYVRLPLIDHRHRLVNGRYVLNAWPIPVFVKRKHGLKSDPYSHGEEFRFRGAVRDRYIGRNKHKKTDEENTNDAAPRKKHSMAGLSSNTLSAKFGGNDAAKHPSKPSSILDHFNKLGHDICQISLEFTRRDFDVVAPLISLGTVRSEDGKKPTWMKKERMILETGKKKKPKRNQSNKAGSKDKNGLDDDDWRRIHNIITRDLIADIDYEEKEIMWRARDQLVHMPEALPIFLRCVDWRDKYFRAETYQYLREWQPPTHLEDALELLGFEFMDTRVREYGVMCIANMHDSDLQRYLLQLVQCLKFELHHNNSLIRLLMRRALQNPYQIGHFLFWHLKSEYHNLEYCERFGLYMEEYLLHSTSHARELLQQSNLMEALRYINRRIYVNKTKKSKQELLDDLHEMIEQLNSQMPTIISLPLNPRWRCTHLIVDKCRFFSSAQVPLLLIFKNVDALADDIAVLFKSGDDLRQDILTLQVFRVMDKVWLDRGLNLRLITYDVVATGDECGMLQIVLNSKTTNHIHVNEGGGPQKGCRDETTHLKFLKKHNQNEQNLESARYNYARSAAGYCVATYVLGIGDRHPDNIMLRENGVIFHIDFGHFLGNFKVKKVVGNYAWKRERTPFVFLPAMKYVMDIGGADKETYSDFQQWFEDAYMALRIRHRLLFNLFTLMIPSVMPELICKNDLVYLKEQLHLDDIPQDKIGKHCKKVIKQCLNDKSRILDNIFHAVKHT